MTATEFRAALKHLKITQRSLAERLGVEPTTVNRWATGKAPVPPYVDYVLKLIAQIDRGEITEEMIAAGAVVVSHAVVDLADGVIGPSCLARLVYLEMRKRAA